MLANLLSRARELATLVASLAASVAARLGHIRCAASAVPLLLRRPGVCRWGEHRADDVYDAIRHPDTLFDARDVAGEAAGDEREVLPEVASGDVSALEGVNLAAW